MFWGLVLEAGKKYAQTVDKPFHVSMASLDVPQSENDLVSVHVNFQNTEYIICNLQKHKVFQTPLDLNFMAGDKIAFYTTGKGRVHLTGYLMEEEEEDDLAAEPEDEDSEEEQIVNANKLKTPVQANKQEKRKSAGHTPGKPVAKKSKMESEDEDEDDDDEGDSDVDGLEDSDGDVEMESGDEDEEEEGEEDEDDEDEDESDEDEEMTPQKLQPQGKNKEKQQSAQKQQNKQLNTPNEMKKKKEKTPGAATPNIQANGTPETLSGKKNKKKGGETPGDGKGGQTPKAGPGTSPGQTPQKKVLEGGIAVEDTVVGSGQVAKPGRFVTVYYTGRLKQNNKKFDETLQGPGFKFRLGKGEVIKGWDIGLTGMKVGGKRKLTIPAHMAYGAKGSPPVIPPNSVLVFDVELRNVN